MLESRTIMAIAQQEKTKILSLLEDWELKIVGQFTWGSNYTFLTRVTDEQYEVEAVYKPQRGERPLWDFPTESLAGREVAAYLVSNALGWDLVPPTAFRQDGPLGPGSLQLRVDHEPEQHYFTFDEATHQRLRPVAIFDILVNNADRKGGHVLIDAKEKLWLIDHGICFHSEPKLRTVVWDFAGEEIPDQLIEDLSGLRVKLGSGLREDLSLHLNADELDAMDERIEGLLASRLFPFPPKDERAAPWPLI
jgi:uncharacterized repeat protein (TIGR03843 family)